MQSKAHWEQVYSAKDTSAVRWFQAHRPTQCMNGLCRKSAT